MQKSILALLKKVQGQRQMGVIFITHDLDVVHAIADRVLVMQHGRIVESGEVNTVLEEPAVQVVPALAELRDRLRALAPFQLSGSGAAWFCPQPEAQADELMQAVRALGLRAQVHRCWSGYPAEVQS